MPPSYDEGSLHPYNLGSSDLAPIEYRNSNNDMMQEISNFELLKRMYQGDGVAHVAPEQLQASISIIINLKGHLLKIARFIPGLRPAHRAWSAAVLMIRLGVAESIFFRKFLGEKPTLAKVQIWQQKFKDSKMSENLDGSNLESSTELFEQI